MTDGKMDQNNEDWARIRERLKRLADDTNFKNLADEINRMLNDSKPLTIEQEVAEVIKCCKADQVFYKELKAQLRKLRGLPQ
jgi:hypothetical protein